MKQRRLLPLSLLCLGLGLAGCSATVLTDVSNAKAEERFLQDWQLEANRFENRLLLKDTVSLFVVVAERKNQAPVELDYNNLVTKTLQESHLFGNLQLPGEAEVKLSENKQMQQNAEVYFDSLRFIAISDRYLSNPLAAYLETDQFLVLQVDRWPCDPCEDGQDPIIRMKVRLVDGASGYVLWTGVLERELFDLEASDLATHTQAAAQDLLNRFVQVYQPKWHRLRYEGLRNL